MLGPRRALTAATVVALSLPAHSLASQSCYGTPSRGGLSVNYARVAFGSGVGGSGTLAGEHVAWTVGGRSVKYGASTTGFGGDTRLAFAFGSSSIKVCPAIGLDYEQRQWTVGAGKLTTMQLSASGGIGAGYDVLVGDNFHVIPFASGRYQFALVKFDFSAANAATQTTADTLSGVHVQYGALVQRKAVFAGFVGERRPPSASASVFRAFAGITFATPRKK